MLFDNSQTWTPHIIEDIHDGSWFHKNIKYWLFFPSGISLLVLWVTGFYMIVLPFAIKMRKKKKLLNNKFSLLLIIPYVFQD